MSSNSLLRSIARPARPTQGSWTALLIAGLVVWFLCLLFGDADRAWRALLINFIYFTPLAAGMVVWPAVIIAARGHDWLRPVKATALAGVGFAPVSFAAFALLWMGRAHWAAWLHETNLPQSAWLNSAFLFSRDAAALIAFWWLAARFARQAGQGDPKRPAAWLAFTYCVVFSLLGLDLVMALDPHWYSSLFGGYFFISGMYIAVAAWTFFALGQRPAPDVNHRKDLGKLVVAFSILTTYMMFCQLLPIWYENLPQEVRFVIPRLRLSPWRWVSLALLASVYLGPLVLLLVNRLKGSIVYLRTITLGVLIGMWLERWWLVTPTLGGRMTLGVVELGITAAFVAALALTMVRRAIEGASP